MSTPESAFKLADAPTGPPPDSSFVQRRRAQASDTSKTGPTPTPKQAPSPTVALLGVEEWGWRRLLLTLFLPLFVVALLFPVLLGLLHLWVPESALPPVRFKYQDWPATLCPVPTMSFNSSCDGVDFANGEPFVIEMEEVQPEWQNLFVSALVHSTQSESAFGIEADLQMEQTLLVRRDEGGEWEDISNPNPVSEWEVDCRQGSSECDESPVMLRSGLPYTAIQLKLKLASTEGTDFIGDVTFHTRHETVSFSYFELLMRYSFVLLSGAVLWWYVASFRLSRGGFIAFSDWQPAQQALLVLLVATMLNNNPLFVLWSATGAWYMQMVEQLLLSMLQHALLLWLLVAVDEMIRPRKRAAPELRSFWVGKMLLVSTLWLLDWLQIVLFQLALRVNPLEEPASLPLYPYLWVYMVGALRVTLIIYFALLFARCLLRIDRRFLKGQGLLKLRALIVVAALTAACLLIAKPFSIQEDDFKVVQVFLSSASLNYYAIVLALLYVPSTPIHTHFDLTHRARRATTELLENTFEPVEDVDDRTTRITGPPVDNADKAARSSLAQRRRPTTPSAKTRKYEAIVSADDEDMSVQLEHLSLRTFVGYLFSALLAVALVLVTLDRQLPQRFVYLQWPATGCPSPTMSFNASCDGVDFAKGEPFVIELDDVQTEWQNLFVSSLVVSTEATIPFGIEADLKMEQTLLVRREEGDEWEDVSNPDPVSEWEVDCKQGSSECDESPVMLRSGLPYTAIQLKLKLVTTERTDFIGDVTFYTRHETVSFTYFELLMRYSFVLLSGAVLWWYVASFRLSRGGFIAFSDWQPAQQALLVLLMATMLNNNPLFVLWSATGAWYMQMVEQLLLSLLQHALLLWMLVVTDSMSHISKRAAPELRAFWVGKAVLVSTLWLLDWTQIVLFQLALRKNPLEEVSGLPGYPYVWEYLVNALRAVLIVYGAALFFRTYIMLLEESKVAHIKRLPFGVFVMLTLLCLLVANPFKLQNDDFSSLRVFASVAALNLYGLLMAMCFVPAPGAVAAFEMSRAQREMAIKVLRRKVLSADGDDRAALYEPELLVRAVKMPRDDGRSLEQTLTLEEQEALDTLLRKNPITASVEKTIDEEAPKRGRRGGAGAGEFEGTVKLDAKESIRVGELVTLIQGRATRLPTTSALSSLWQGQVFAAGDATVNAQGQELVRCISEGPALVKVHMRGPAPKGTPVLVLRCGASAPADSPLEPRALYATVEPRLELLAQQIGYLSKEVTADEVRAATLPGKSSAVVDAMVELVGPMHDPFEGEGEHFPFAVVLKDVTDPELLKSAKSSQVVALSQAVDRATKMRHASPVPTDDDRDAGVGVDGSGRFDPSDEAGLIEQLTSGTWKDDKPHSTEEQEVLTLFGDHFEVRLFHVQRGSGRKSLFLLQMKEEALRREHMGFILERWQEEGNGAFASTSGQEYDDIEEVLKEVKQGRFPLSPAERFELYERLLRKLFHANELGLPRLPLGELAEVADDPDMSMEQREQLQLDNDRRFVAPSFCVYERRRPLRQLARDELLELMARHYPTTDASAMDDEELRAALKPPASEAHVSERQMREESEKRGANVELFECYFPRSNHALNQWCKRTIASKWKMSFWDLTIIRNHFGEELALFLALQTKYFDILGPFAALGLTLQIAVALSPGGTNANWFYIAPFFAAAMIVFSVLLQLLWRQENERLAHGWGCLRYTRSDYVRRDFKGERRFSSVKQRYEYDYPEWKRWLYIKPLSFLVVLMQTLLLIVITFALYMQMQDTLENPSAVYDIDVLDLLFGEQAGTVLDSVLAPLLGSDLTVRWILGTVVNALLYVVLIMVLMVMFFAEVAQELGSWENYRTEQEFNDQFVLKMFFFIFVDGFMMFWILGLYHIPLAMYSSFEQLEHIRVAGVQLFYKDGQLENYLAQLTAMPFAALVIVAILTLSLENLLPYIIAHFVNKGRRKQRKGLGPKALFLHTVLDEAERDKLDLFGDYYDFTLTAAYGVVYALLMPLAPLVIWLNQLVEIRTDFVKCLDIFRRPNPRKVARIGMWEWCMWFQTYTNVVQIVIIAAYGTRMFDEWAAVFGLSYSEAPQLYEEHGVQRHLRRDVKLLVSIALIIMGLALIGLTAMIVGEHDPVTKLRIERSEYLERQHKLQIYRKHQAGEAHPGRATLAPPVEHLPIEELGPDMQPQRRPSVKEMIANHNRRP